MECIMIVFLANMLWFLASFPKWLTFLIFGRDIKNAQLRLLRKILKENEKTCYGREHISGDENALEKLKALPLTDYKDYEKYIKAIKKGEKKVLTKDEVLLLEPTGGSSNGSKLIPYTGSLQNQFRKAIDAWIFNTFLFKFSLLFGKHYWSVSPNTRFTEDDNAKVKIGFAEDTEYLGLSQRLLTKILFAVPTEISKLDNMNSFEYLTLLFLMREKNLRLISIWNPSFLIVLIEKLNTYYDKIISDIRTGLINESIPIDPALRLKLQKRLKPNPERSKELSLLDISDKNTFLKIWPRLKLISCWTDGNSSVVVRRLKEFFPGVEVEGKGIIATEGIISIPFGRHKKKTLAYRSHFFEFIDRKSGLIKNAWQLETDAIYSIVLTTGGGLYRYRLYDLVKITGSVGKIPCFDFISKEDIVSDIVGEKINESHVEKIFRRLEEEFNFPFSFRFLAPVKHGNDFHYSLFISPMAGKAYDYKKITEIFDKELVKNYHYQHALNLSQLKPLKIFLIKEGTESQVYLDHLRGKGQKAGDIKICFLRKELEWDKVFTGHYYNDKNQATCQQPPIVSSYP